ncbi:MAG: BMP family ABC transporter substrate-binding protein [Sphaerochaetaceae bacterium]
MKKLTVLLLMVMLACSFGFAQGTSESATAKTNAPLKVGMIYIGPVGDMGYTYVHDLGTKAAEKYFGNKIEVVRMESVEENENSERAMESLIDEGCKIIFATSYNYQQYMLNVANAHPEVYFEHCSGYLKNNTNMSNYFGRMYQIRYLSGMVAGKMSPSGKIGYVGAFNTPEVVRGINAFTLGARSINPKATVTVVWTNTWYDPSLERQAAVSLLDQGVDLMAQHQDTTEPAKAALEHGKYAIGYNADFRSIIKDDKVLCSPEWDWSKYVIPSIQSVLDGKFVNQSYWGGSNEGIVYLSEMSPLVSADFQAQVKAKAEELKKGTFDVFWGELKDNTGKIRQNAGAKMSDSDMLTMDWFVEGVVGKVK